MSATCSETFRGADEPTGGTAPLASGWMAIEVDGAWGRDALTESALDPGVGSRLTAAAKAAGVKVIAIRRPGRHAVDRRRPRTVLLGHSGPRRWLERLTVATDAELDALDPAVCAGQEAPGWGEQITEPQFLVCTHARRDRCCATLGRPIVDTIAALHPDQAWEASHLGGHRFAGNLLVLPHGLVYGSLDIASALATVAATLSDRLEIEHLRGRSDWPRVAQAADVAVRRAEGFDAVDDVALVGVAASQHSRDDTQLVTLRTPSGALEVSVAREPIGARLLSCDADAPEDPHTFRVTDIRPTADDTR